MGIGSCDGIAFGVCWCVGLRELPVEFDDELLILLIEQTLDLRELNEPGDDGGV